MTDIINKIDEQLNEGSKARSNFIDAKTDSNVSTNILVKDNALIIKTDNGVNVEIKINKRQLTKFIGFGGDMDAKAKVTIPAINKRPEK